MLEYLQLHEEYHTFGKPTKIACSEAGCRAEFFTSAKLNWHLYEAHHRDANRPQAGDPPPQPVCRFCSRTFQSQLEMLVHRVDCEKTAGATRRRPVEGFPCSRCGKVFTASRFIANHSLTCDAVPTAQKNTATSEPLAKRFKSEDAEAVGSEVTKGIKGEDAKEEVIGKDTKEIKSEDTKDVKSEATSGDQNTTAAAGGPRFCCDYTGCGKVFLKQVQLRNHLYSHNRYPYACSLEGCGLGFAQKENYLQHARQVHPETPVQLVSCAQCDLDFGSRDQLEAHKEEAHEEEEDLLGDSFCEEPENEELDKQAGVCILVPIVHPSHYFFNPIPFTRDRPVFSAH